MNHILFLADNEGSHQAMLTKTGNTFFPCRICEARREDMMNSDLSEYYMRHQDSYTKYLKYAFDSFCTSVKIQYPRNLPDRMKRCLEFCQNNSLQPLLPAFSLLQPCYKGHSTYSMVPPDLMHTFIGFMESWISMVMTIVAKIKHEYVTYSSNLSTLEEKLANFPFKQAMPFKCKHFNRGLTIYIPGLDSNLNDKTTGYGELKLIDYKDVPSLMLQLIICKLYFISPLNNIYINFVQILFHNCS